MSPTKEKIREIDVEMATKVEKHRESLRKIPIRGYFSEKVMPDVLLGMTLRVVNIDYVNNIIAFKLVK